MGRPSTSKTKFWRDNFHEASRIAAGFKTQLAEANAEITTLRESMAWRDIETAPKDGTHVLLFEPEGYFIIQGHHWTTGWITFDGGEPLSPTHWKPLPSPPKSQRDSSGEGERDAE